MNNFYNRLVSTNVDQVCYQLDLFKHFIDTTERDGVDLYKAQKEIEKKKRNANADDGSLNPIFQMFWETRVNDNVEGLGWFLALSFFPLSPGSEIMFSCNNTRRNKNVNFFLSVVNNNKNNNNLSIKINNSSIMFNVFSMDDNLTLKILRKLGIILNYYPDFLIINFGNKIMQDTIKNKIAYLDNQRKAYDFMCKNGYFNSINIPSQNAKNYMNHFYNDKFPLGSREKCINKYGKINKKSYYQVYKSFPVLNKIKQCIGNFFAFCDRESFKMSSENTYNQIINIFTNVYKYCYKQNDVNNQDRMNVINNLASIFGVDYNDIFKTFTDIHKLCKDSSLISVVQMISTVCVDHFNDINMKHLEYSIRQHYKIQFNMNQKNNMKASDNNNNNKMTNFSNNLNNCIKSMGDINKKNVMINNHTKKIKLLQ